MMKKHRILAAVLAASICAFAQEAIKFQIPTDSTGAPMPVAAPAKPDTVHRLGVVQNVPLNLPALSVKDTAGFQTYSKRLALVQDSIYATYRGIEAVKTRAWSLMQKLEPKGEFEKQAEFDARQSKWNHDYAQMVERDTKSLTSRLAELERAKAKIQENQSSLYASAEIKSNPSSVSVWIGRDEIGTTPADYKLLIPGEVKISLRKDGYNQWDTMFTVTAGGKYKIGAVLEEKSIFSIENEIDFVKILKKDTTLQGYLARIETVNARKAQIEEEIKQIMADFSNTYPALEPQKADETKEQFDKRQDIWKKEGMRQYSELQRKADSYKMKLNRSIEVLNDHIVANESSIINETALNAKIMLGNYDADKEVFALAAQDSANEKSPFAFKGHVGIPLNTAKTLNREAPGFAATLQFINYPFKMDSSKVNLAMSKLQISMGGQDLKVEGSFDEIAKYKEMEGYGAWKLHADSILSGKLKAKNLDYAYAMGRAAAKDAVDVAKDGGKGGFDLGWRAWTRIATYTLAAGCATMAILSNSDAGKHKDKRDELIKKGPKDNKEYNEMVSANDKLKDSEGQRTIFGIGAGVFAIAGTATFFF